jgi:hypothetical protein
MAAVWNGAILAIAVLLRRRNSGTQPSPSGQERETAFTGLAIFLLSAGMFVALRHPHHPHYYNGAWSGALILLLLALGTGWGWRIVRAAYALYLVCMASLLLDVQTALHRRGGDATLRYGPTLGNQCEVAAMR